MPRSSSTSRRDRTGPRATPSRMARAFEPYRLYWLEDALPEGDLDGWKRLRAGNRDGALHRREELAVPDFRRLIATAARST